MIKQLNMKFLNIFTFWRRSHSISINEGQISNHNSQVASQPSLSPPPSSNQIPTIDLTVVPPTPTLPSEKQSVMMKEEMQIIDVNSEHGNKIIIATEYDGYNQSSNSAIEYKSKFRNIFNEWSSLLALLIIFLMLWAIGYALLPSFCAINGPFMRMAFLFVGAQLSGILITFIKLPDMLGMLFFGVLYTNLGLGDFSEIQGLEASLRDMALINIMLLAGLGVDLQPLKKLFRIIMQLTLLPTIAEVAALTVLSHYLLNMPWIWGILLGLVVTAISPNVVVTVLLRLKEEKLGMNKGIHTVIIAMTSCNDVLAIFLFGVILGVIFSTGDLTSQILQGPIGICIGLAYGVITGFIMLYLPNNQAKYVNGLKFTMITLMGSLSVYGSKAIKYPSAGALGCITTAFIATEGWKRQKDSYQNNEVGMYLDLLWKFLKPISFSLIGKEVNFKVLDGNTVLYGAITLLIGVIFRLVVSYFSAYGAKLNWKEKAYAALGPLALDMARKLNSEENYEYANAVLIISVLAIIFTAPLGAILMIRLAPKWLQKGPELNT
uniref:CSON007078 protein n=2 Tax=Culicoides sonorensis TaxID=179676 RepID=A0A336LX08_CULSO